ncbi:hypothetical protein TWF192_005331 [Orbilia oligospora]|nr:hypothetical protein TWF192_005331 [Orbilia oligospora]
MRVASAKLLAVLMATSSGTLFIYQGQEIGMTSMPREWGIQEYKDNETVRYYEAVREGRASGESLEYALSSIRKVARDHGRTPMQWDTSLNSGFTSAVKSWMRVNENYAEVNVEFEEENENSVLDFWKRVLRIRKRYWEVFIAGRFELFDVEEGGLRNRVGVYWKYEQEQERQNRDLKRALVVMNFSTMRVAIKDVLEEERASLEAKRACKDNVDKTNRV